mmetsp:Transcript_13114/g.37769  ORF Transcript_13114/g.37769 Transcript_13114/m.37769 type:complete len:503 (+) Transcript_13114:1003-2511(+)
MPAEGALQNVDGLAQGLVREVRGAPGREDEVEEHDERRGAHGGADLVVAADLVHVMDPAPSQEHLAATEARKKATKVREVRGVVVGEERSNGVEEQARGEGRDAPSLARLEERMHDLPDDGPEHHALNSPQVFDHSRADELRKQHGSCACDACVVGAEDVPIPDKADGEAAEDRRSCAQGEIQVLRVGEDRPVPQRTDGGDLRDARQMVRIMPLLNEVLGEAERRAHEAGEIQAEHMLRKQLVHAELGLFVPKQLLARDVVARLCERPREGRLLSADRNADILEGFLLDLGHHTVKAAMEAELEQHLDFGDGGQKKGLDALRQLRVRGAPVRRARDGIRAIDPVVAFIDDPLQGGEDPPHVVPLLPAEALIPRVADVPRHRRSQPGQAFEMAEYLIAAVSVGLLLANILGQGPPEKRQMVHQLLRGALGFELRPPRVGDQCHHDAQEAADRHGDHAVDSDIAQELEIVCERALEVILSGLQEGHPEEDEVRHREDHRGDLPV